MIPEVISSIQILRRILILFPKNRRPAISMKIDLQRRWSRGKIKIKEETSDGDLRQRGSRTSFK